MHIYQPVSLLRSDVYCSILILFENYHTTNNYCSTLQEKIMGETLEENWVCESLVDEGRDEQVLGKTTSLNNNKNNKKRSAKRPPNDQQNKKPKKERGLRSFATSEDQGMLSTTENTLSGAFWAHYIKAMGNDLTELQKSNLLKLNKNCFVTCRNEAGWKDCGIIIKAGLPNWKTKMSTEKLEKQSPRVIVICGSANRAIKLIKEIRVSIQNQFFVAKFFSRHIKLKQNVEMLTENDGKNVPIIVGTPGRVYKLLDENNLLLSGTDLLIVDMSRDCMLNLPQI
jgi:hypothetical protein